MTAILFQDWIDLKEVVIYGPAFAQLVLALIFLLRGLPVWKEVKLREIELREAEVRVRGAEAEALKAVSEVLYEVSIEQRRAADSVKILQRINKRGADDLEGLVGELAERLGKLEGSVNCPLTSRETSA